jgi:uncharacterized repeat protein (TIGR01451 family)
MLAGKMKEIKKTVKRIYSRFVILTAVVVFGAIAIAQGQKDAVDGSSGEPPQLLAGFSGAAPIPVSDTSGMGEAGPTIDDLPPIQPASANVALPDDIDADPGMPATWSQEIPYDDDPSSDHPSSDHPPASYDEMPADYQDPDDAAFDATPPQYADAAFATDEEDYAYDDAVADTDDAPPLLPDHEPAPLQDNSSTTASSRKNPYREASAPAPQPTPAGESDYDAPPTLPGSDDLVDEQDVAPAASAPYAPAAVSSRSAGPQQPVNASVTSLDDPLDYDPDATGYDQTPNARATSASPPVATRAAAPHDVVPAEQGMFRQQDPRAARSASPMEVARRNEFEATGRPGPQTMEGPQTPTLTLQKVAPPELQVGRAATFQIRVRNVGRVPADNVLIRDEIPAGTDFVDATPKATRAADGAVYWEVGSLAPGQEIVIATQLMPTTEGQVGSVATVSFEASASARTRATKPELVLEHTGPVQALVGEQVRFAIKISNPGTGAATKVILQEDVPTGLSHPSGSKLEYEVGTIEPGQTRHLELTLQAAKAGQVLNKIVATAEANLIAEHTVELEVIAPQLQVSIEGPKRRYLERQATFTVAVANPGTAPARNVELIAKLPQGLQFVSTNNSGYYDQSRHAVVWSLEQLPAGEMGRAQFTAMPVEIGTYAVKAEGRAETELFAEQEHPLSIEGIAALLYVLADKIDPLEVNGQTTYEIKVTNQGSKDATNIRFAALVPDGMRPVSATGPTAERIDGQQVEFAALERLAPKQEATFQVTAEGITPGDHRFRVQMISDEISTPVIKEESTRVYAD